LNLPLVGYKLILSYCGTGFRGWQKQGQLPTVQRFLEEAVAKIWETNIHVEGASRTDAGVHAKGQVASFIAPRKHEAEVVQRALNYYLPDTIRVLHVRVVSKEFHARFHAISKTYQYWIWNDPVMDPFYLWRAWHIPRQLDIKGMNEATRLFVGKKDFASFVSYPGFVLKDTTKTVFDCGFTVQGQLCLFTIKADGFLYRMVRNIVGALVKIGLGRLDLEKLKVIFESKNRKLSPASAPPWGLYLMKVDYPPDMEINH